MVARLDRYGEERMSYIQYRWGGRGAKEIEESVGRESESIDASKEKPCVRLELSKPTRNGAGGGGPHTWRMKVG